MKQFFPNSMQNLNANALGDSVDIITRTKDRPILLVRALASVLSQTHNNWHLYLVNDGGDKVKLEKTLKSYLPAFGDKITVINHDVSQGMEAASNAGFQRSKGDFIVIHDDDDCWHPSFLSTCVSFLRKPENRRFTGVITNCEVVQEVIADGRVNEYSREAWGYFRNNITYQDLLFTNIAPPISFLIRKDAANAAGTFNSNLPVLGDWDYILRIMQIGDIATIDEKLAYYHHRINNYNSTSTYQNAVTHGVDRHQLYNTLYTNAAIRATLNENPALFGLFRMMAVSKDREINELKHEHRAQIHTLEQSIQWQMQLNQQELKKLIKKEVKNTSIFRKVRLELKRWRNKYFGGETK